MYESHTLDNYLECFIDKWPNKIIKIYVWYKGFWYIGTFLNRNFFASHLSLAHQNPFYTFSHMFSVHVYVWWSWSRNNWMSVCRCGIWGYFSHWLHIRYCRESKWIFFAYKHKIQQRSCDLYMKCVQNSVVSFAHLVSEGKVNERVPLKTASFCMGM